MRRLNYLCIALLTMLLVASCSENEVILNDSGNEANVSFALQLPNDGPQTRAIGDGETVNKLVFEVYDEVGNKVANLSSGNIAGFPQSVRLSLLKGKTYQIAFWAQNSACKAYGTGDLKNVTVSYAGNNDETCDAFFKTIEFTVDGNATMDVVLKRPFAQLNVGVTTDDWTKATAAGFTVVQSQVTINNAATSINLLTGKVAGDAVAKLNSNIIPTETLKVGTDCYKYLSMSYFLVNDGSETGAKKATIESLEFVFSNDATKSMTLTQGLTNVPVQRNYRTNILGKLLTGDIQFDISIDPIFEGDWNQIRPGKAIAYAQLIKNPINEPEFYGRVSIEFILNHAGFGLQDVKNNLKIELFNEGTLLATNSLINLNLSGAGLTSPFYLGRKEAVVQGSWNRGAYITNGYIPTAKELPTKVVATYVIGNTTYISETNVTVIAPIVPGIHTPVSGEGKIGPNDYGTLNIFTHKFNKLTKVNDLKNMSMDVTVKSGIPYAPTFVIITKNNDYLTSWFKEETKTSYTLIWGQEVWQITRSINYSTATNTYSTTSDNVTEYYEMFGDLEVDRVEVHMWGGPQQIEMVNFKIN